jgi:hypothetical protein
MPFQDQNFNLKIEGKMAFWGNIYRQRRKKRYWMHLSDEHHRRSWHGPPPFF